MSNTVLEELAELKQAYQGLRKVYEPGGFTKEEQDDLDAFAKRIADYELVVSVGLAGDDGATANGSPAKNGQALPSNVNQAGPQDNRLQLLFEQKTLRDKLKEPRSYRGREADEARLKELDAILGESMKQPVAPLPPKDPRVAELVAETRRELSDELDPDTASLTDRKLNGHMIEEYYEIRRELKENYLDNIDGQKHTSKDIGEAALKAWAKAIYDVGELRRVLSSNVVVQHRDAEIAEQAQLKTLYNELQTLKAKNKRVQAEVERIEKLKGAMKWAGHMLHLNDVLETFGSGVEEITLINFVAVSATNAATALSNSNLTRAAGQLEEAFDHLAEYPIQLAVAIEGYASIEDLEKDIKRKVQDINDKITSIRSLNGRRERAQKVYDTAVSEAPKTK